MIVGIGCDIVEIERLKKNQELLARRILTKKEMELYDCYQEERQLEFLAGRFAAKEAIIKAIDEKKLLSDIEILNNKDGNPIVGIDHCKIHLSISHEEKYAIAYAICER